MKKIFTKFLLLAALAGSVTFSYAQTSGTGSGSEAVGTGTSTAIPSPGVQALLDQQFSYNITTTTGSVGNAGIVHLGSEFWVAKWQSDTVWVLDNTGNLVSSFFVPLGAGGGIRALTTDGNMVYASQNGPNIVIIDKVTKTVTGSIPVPALGFSVRSLTYDPTADGGAGGFWVSNFGTSIIQVDMTGGTLNTITAGTHGLAGMYGTVVDNISSLGSQFLWVFDQPGNPGATLWQLDVATGTQTGVTLDVNLSLGYAGLAGGVCIATGIAAQPSLCAVIQQTPNSIEGFELPLPVGLNETGNASDISIFPVPATEYIYFVVNDLNAASLNVEVFDVKGQLVSAFASADKKITVATGDFAPGVYTVTISDGVAKTSRKFMVK